MPLNPPYFKTLLKELKSFCWTGGSLKEDHIEIQGYKIQKIKGFIVKNVFKSKNSDLIMAYLKWIGCEHFKSHSLPPKKTDYPTTKIYKCECHNNLMRTISVMD